MSNGPETPLLLVGPVTLDTIDGQRVPGGAVSYGATVAAAFGVGARILTIAGPDADLEIFSGHDLHVIEDPHTLSFEFDQQPGGRVMRVPHLPTRALTAEDLPVEWRTPDCFIAAPLVLGDLDIDSFATVGESARRTGVVMQGLQRAIGDDSFVNITPPPDISLVRTCSSSYTFFRSAREAQAWTTEQQQLVLHRGARIVTTLGSAGARLEREGVTLEVDAFPIEHEVDATGAGDVFATALILALDEGEPAAAQIAAAFAAASVEQIGPQPLPSLSEIKRRLSAHQAIDQRRGAHA